MSVLPYSVPKKDMHCIKFSLNYYVGKWIASFHYLACTELTYSEAVSFDIWIHTGSAARVETQWSTCLLFLLVFDFSFTGCHCSSYWIFNKLYVSSLYTWCDQGKDWSNETQNNLNYNIVCNLKVDFPIHLWFLQIKNILPCRD